jgi:hypothetical protein
MRSMAMELQAVEAPLGLLADGLDRLHEEDPLDQPSSALGRELCDLFTLRARLDAEVTRRVAAFDRTQGYAAFDSYSTAAWLRHQARLSPSAASEQVRVARELEQLPEVGRAFAGGEVGFQHCAVITRTVEGASPEVIAEAEPALLQAAQQVDPFRLAQYTRHLRHAFAAEACLKEANAAHERRRLHLSQSLGGLYFLEGTLDSEGGATLCTALDAVMGPPAQDDERTPAQRRADALVDLARRQLDGGELGQVGGQRPHLTLTADLATLAKLPGSRAADLDWGQPVPSETLRRIACDASLTPVLVSESGDPLSVGRTRRTFSGPLRKALALRDQGCVLCGRPVAWCTGHPLGTPCGLTAVKGERLPDPAEPVVKLPDGRGVHAVQEALTVAANAGDVVLSAVLLRQVDGGHHHGGGELGLASLGIGRAQVALDGGPPGHPMGRHLSKGSFEGIDCPSGQRCTPTAQP